MSLFLFSLSEIAIPAQGIVGPATIIASATLYGGTELIKQTQNSNEVMKKVARAAAFALLSLALVSSAGGLFSSAVVVWTGLTYLGANSLVTGTVLATLGSIAFLFNKILVAKAISELNREFREIESFILNIPHNIMQAI